MVFCIIIKWLQSWDGRESISIISLFINFFEVDNPLYATANFQQDIQQFLTIVSFICVILMLFPKPIINSLHKKQQKMIKLIHNKEID